MNDSIPQLIHQSTGGRPFVFLVTRFKSEARREAGKALAAALEEQLDLACIRADDVHASGQDLLQKVHALIHRAEAVVADLTDPGSENVYYEVGYAEGRNKPVILMQEGDAEIAVDLRGREVQRYDGRTKEAFLSSPILAQIDLALKNGSPSSRTSSSARVVPRATSWPILWLPPPTGRG